MEKKKEFIINCLFFSIIFALVYLGINYVMPIVIPFILGFVFAYCARALSKHLFNKDDKGRRVASLLIIYGLIVLTVVILIIIGVDNVIALISNLPSIYKTTIAPYIAQFQKQLIVFNESLPENISSVLSETITSLFNSFNSAVTKAVGSLVSGTTNVIKSAPNFIISIILTLVSSFYILLDYEDIMEWLDRALPEGIKKSLGEVKHFCRNTLFKIIGSYALIMLITFTELFIGFSIFRISNGVLWAFLIAFMDILPVLGVGAALIPWVIISLVIGDTVMGIEIAILYIVITIVRNYIEPKLVGGNLGLHPLVTLVSMIVGMNILGAVGMFGLPLTLSFLNSKYRNGK